MIYPPTTFRELASMLWWGLTHPDAGPRSSPSPEVRRLTPEASQAPGSSVSYLTMSVLHLKYLGLSDADVKALRDVVKAQHPKGGMQTASYCACGASSGGPAGSAACRALEVLLNAGREAKNDRPPRRDPSVCNHQLGNTVRSWVYEGKTHCELCGSVL